MQSTALAISPYAAGQLCGHLGEEQVGAPEQMLRHWARLDLVRLLLDDVTSVRAAACATRAASRAPDLPYRTTPRRPLLGHRVRVGVIHSAVVEF